MEVIKKRTRQIALDILGLLLVVASILTSPIPGPGGFPLFILGLSVLSINHHWARQLLQRIRTDGKAVVDRIFTDNKAVMLALDILGVMGLVSGLYCLLYQHGTLRILGFSGTILSLSILGYNRQRFAKLKKQITKKP
jgi:uncharacterized membrane protein